MAACHSVLAASKWRYYEYLDGPGKARGRRAAEEAYENQSLHRRRCLPPARPLTFRFLRTGVEGGRSRDDSATLRTLPSGTFLNSAACGTRSSNTWCMRKDKWPLPATFLLSTIHRIRGCDCSRLWLPAHCACLGPCPSYGVLHMQGEEEGKTPSSLLFHALPSTTAFASCLCLPPPHLYCTATSSCLLAPSHLCPCLPCPTFSCPSCLHLPVLFCPTPAFLPPATSCHTATPSLSHLPHSVLPQAHNKHGAVAQRRMPRRRSYGLSLQHNRNVAAYCAQGGVPFC